MTPPQTQTPSFGTAWVVPKAPATSWHKGKRPNWAQQMEIQCTKGGVFFPHDVFVVQKMVCVCYILDAWKRCVNMSSILQEYLHESWWS